MTAVPDEQPTVRLGPADAARCRRRIHLDHDPDADRTLQRRPDAGLQLRFDTLAAHGRSIQAVLAASLPLETEWDPSYPERPSAIWRPRLTGRHRFATPDLLLRAPDGGYVPVLVRGHRTTDPGAGARLTAVGALTEGSWPVETSATRKLRNHHADVLALAHVHRLLTEWGLASREMLGGIIGFGGSSTDPACDDGALIAWHRLDAPTGGNGITPLAEYDDRFADRLKVATAAATRAPALAQPSRIAECRRCPWWTVCGPELAAAHDVSLLVAGGDVEVLRAAGARTFDDIATMDPTLLATLPLTGIPAAEAATRAQAMIAGQPLVRRDAGGSVVRADVELDIDMESYLDDGAYLWGTYLTGIPVAGFRPGYRPFVTWQPLDNDATATNFVTFWRYLSELREACAAAGLTFAAYCYSHKAEERWLYGTPARFPDVPGMPSRDEVAAFCASPQWVDLYTEVKRLFIVPGSLRLKAIAPVAGFAWRDPEPGGENSMAWYRIATGQHDPAAGDNGAIAANRTRILQYNEDDVRATLILRQWMSDHSDVVPTADELAASTISTSGARATAPRATSA